ncbi:MAG: dockerin type I repeat-containing protein [candidate division Zixibacteria bacterium]|nr:dockerin type I repeat-containing protein [candidate division Zixibacteria bacterium]
MVRKAGAVVLFCLVLISSAAGYTLKRDAVVSPLNNQTLQTFSFAPNFATAEACTVRHDNGPWWLIQHWVTGAELYKSYQNPTLSCTTPYPFTVLDVQIVMGFERRCTLYVSVDVESADLSTPSCPAPGNLLSISSEYMFNIPGSGLYLLSVPLDSPAVVNDAYFAGFYISNVLDTLIGASVVTDSIPALCTGYNIWDTAIGYIDLANNSYFNFPGRLLLFSSGTTGGSGVQPEPSIILLKPGMNELLLGAVKLWGSENSGSTIIDSVRFEDRRNGSWTRIGIDADGQRALRNGVDPSGTGDGYALDWNYSALTEGAYWLKAAAFDTLGRFDVDSHQVSIDPTPPDLTMLNPTSMDTLCLPTKLEVTSLDENITQVKFERKAAPWDFNISITPLAQSKYGDKNGNPNDGNHAASGEYGDYYCGPVVGAMAVKYWFDKGFLYSMREGTSYISVDTVVERLAANMQTRANKGTYDDLFYGGILQYIATHGNELQLDLHRRPDYAEFRTIFQENELTAIMALGGMPGAYVMATGANGLLDGQGRYPVKIADPISGSIITAYIKNVPGGAQVYYRSSWHDLEMIITVKGYSLTVTRELIGTDNSAVGGWTFDWNSSNMVKDSLYFITATATDATGRIGMVTNLVQYGCPVMVKGDYDGNGVLNIGDVLYLINFIYKKGPAPSGGAGRADANCNGDIDISDIICAIKYIYTAGPAPCY